MKNFQVKNKNRSFVYSKQFLIFLGIVVLFFIWQIFGFVQKAQMASKNRKIAEDKNKELILKKENLEGSLGKLYTAEGKEDFIKENYGLVKEGEEIVILTEEDSLNTEKEKKSSGFLNIFNKDN